MDMRLGYKQTEVGVIPPDWEVRQFSEHFRICAGGDVPKHSLSHTQSAAHPYPIFANALQNKGLYGYTAERRSNANSVTITARGYLGHAEYRDQPFFPIVRLLVLEPTGQLDARYATYAINDRVRFSIESTGVPQLTAPQVGKYSVAAPPTIEEQRAIANVLSDVDVLLDRMDQLIAKKRDLKQAAMQQLLTGKTRMPGFKDEWEQTTAGQIGRFRGGSGFPTKYQGGVEGEYPFFKVSDMNNEGNETFMRSSNNWISESVRKAISATVFPTNSIVFAKVGAAIFLERKKILLRPSCIDNNLAALVLDANRADFRFVHYLLLFKKLGELVATTALPSLNGRRLSAIPVALPSRPEQRAIASVLSDMDADLLALETRREKTRALKQGMMQELLTGKTRLA